jgi:murein DD-endopeptidase MepM/ murein hydrolase activator NlpD
MSFLNMISGNLSFLPKYFLLFFLVSGFFCFSAYSDNNGNNGEKDQPNNNKDTVRAINFHGDKFLIKPSIKWSDELIISYIDSLFSTTLKPKEIQEQLNLYLSIKDMSDERIYALIDSLFDLQSVPYKMINQINYFIAIRNGILEDEDLKAAVAITAFYDDSEFPANCFYDSWDTEITHPYSDDLWKEDSTPILLVLQDSVNFCNYNHPHDGIITSHYGWREGRLHKGIDIGLRTGEPITAAFDGMVRIARNHGGYGNVVVIRHYNGLETLYAHLHRIKVKPGQEVQAGQLIGLGGNTGRSTGAHLHFEVLFKGKQIDPRHIIDLKEKRLVSEAFILNKNNWSYSAYPEGAEFHLVERGEYLQMIAQRYGLTLNEICSMNNISRKTVLKVGQKIRIS